MNLPTFLILMAVVAIVGLIIWKIVKDRRAGKSHCDSCGNADCCMTRAEMENCSKAGKSVS
ncbi:MAG: FeoB-associated Cys-rich membrane protein [Clostridia bacterium]|nr:FeoB-associated Cys-rich membrane protein [Clostridia bacterium]